MSMLFLCVILLYYIPMRFLAAEAAKCAVFFRHRDGLLKPWLREPAAVSAKAGQKLGLMTALWVLDAMLLVLTVMLYRMSAPWMISLPAGLILCTAAAFFWYARRMTAQVRDIAAQPVHSLPDWLKELQGTQPAGKGKASSGKNGKTGAKKAPRKKK